MSGKRELVAESKLWAQGQAWFSDGLALGGCTVCQILAAPLRTLQLTSCALPHILLCFWPSAISPPTLTPTRAMEMTGQEEDSVRAGSGGLMAHSVVSLWPGHKPSPGALTSTDPNALGGFGFTWQLCRSMNK